MGDRTLSYNQVLSFILILRAPANVNRMYTHADISIEGANGVKVGAVIYGGLQQTIPSEDPLTFRFRYANSSTIKTIINCSSLILD